MIHIRKQAGFTSALAFSTRICTLAYSGEQEILHFHQSKKDLCQKPFVCHLQDTEMLQSVEQMEFLSGSHHPQQLNWTLGREYKPQTSPHDPIPYKHRAHTTGEGHGGGCREKVFFRENHRRGFQKLLYSTLLMSPPECQQHSQDILRHSPCLHHCFKQCVGAGKENTLRRRLLHKAVMNQPRVTA